MSRDRLAARLLGIFLTELQDQLESLNTELLALETEPEDAGRLAAVFRIMHTLKGAASAAQVPLIERVCHALEARLATAREGKASLGRDDFSLLFAAADALRDAGERVRSGGDLTDSPLGDLDARLRRETTSVRPTPAPSPPRAAIPAVATEPPAAEPAPARAAARATPPTAAHEGLEEHVRVEAAKLDGLLSSAGQLLITAGRITARPAELDELRETAERWRTAWGSSSRRARIAVTGTDAAVPVLRLMDEVDDQLREIVREASRLAAASRHDARILFQETRQIGDRVRRLRLRPFSDACVALPRAVRDLAAASGKEVSLEISGGEVEADRAVLDLLHEMLLHLVRNAVDHGMESPEERERKGKPRVGTIRISGALDGQRLLITVHDDGRGLDAAAIEAQLVSRGLPVPGTREELGRAAFRAGFSTRTEVTSISGRGVGLDVVATTIERVRGSVGVEWVEGEGTTFTLECSPTLATVHAVLARIGSQIVAIPSAHVEHLDMVRPEEIHRSEGRAVVLNGEKPVPIVSLARLLGPPLLGEPPAGALPVARLLVGGRRLAVAVDELMTEEEIVIRSLERLPQPPPLLAGASLLPTGRIALVLNTAALVAEGLARGALDPTVAHSGPAPAAPARIRILVADDSITTRTLEQSILEAAGFDVTTAVDGLDAWGLVQERPFDLVVSDVEMPRMDGFSLCQAIRGSQRVAGLPLILVTALDAPEHRARGLEAGADAYLPKSSFDHQDLLDTIRQLLG